MESITVPKTGSGGCSPTSKSPINAGNNTSNQICVTLRYDSDTDNVGVIYPLCESSRSDIAQSEANISSITASRNNCDAAIVVVGESQVINASQQVVADEPSSISNYFQGHIFCRKSGQSPTMQQQQSQNDGCNLDFSGSGSRSPSSPNGAVGFTHNGSIPRASTCSDGISPSAKYNQNIVEFLGAAATSCSNNDNDLCSVLPPLGQPKVGSGTQGSSPAESVSLVNVGGFVRNGLDMRHLNHCLGDIMRSMTSGEGQIATAGGALSDCMRVSGKAEDHRLSSMVVPASNSSDVVKLSSILRSSPHLVTIVGTESGVGTGSEQVARYSRKVFVGGLPPDIDEDEITTSFRRFGTLVVDWPHKAESKSYFPPKGYAFLLFQDETSVQNLIDACILDDEKLYLCVSSPTIKDKPVQIRPWRLNDADYVLDATMSLDPRKTVFVGGVPRPLKAFELAMIMDRLYGGVCYAGIDTDPELKYPKGAGRVAFSNQQSYISAISARFVQLQHADIDKRVEVKPYVLDDQMCDECEGQRCSGKFAPFFCANVTCLQYYCEHCWAVIHSRPGREYHKPLVKEGADRPRAVPFRWC